MPRVTPDELALSLSHLRRVITPTTVIHTRREADAVAVYVIVERDGSHRIEDITFHVSRVTGFRMRRGRLRFAVGPDRDLRVADALWRAVFDTQIDRANWTDLTRVWA